MRRFAILLLLACLLLGSAAFAQCPPGVVCQQPVMMRGTEYQLADSSGKTWTSPDWAWLNQWVGICNERIRVEAESAAKAKAEPEMGAMPGLNVGMDGKLNSGVLASELSKTPTETIDTNDSEFGSVLYGNQVPIPDVRRAERWGVRQELGGLQSLLIPGAIVASAVLLAIVGLIGAALRPRS